MVVIEGQHLRQVYDQLHRNVTPWVMQAARDFPEKNKPFVSKLTFIDSDRTRTLDDCRSGCRRRHTKCQAWTFGPHQHRSYTVRATDRLRSDSCIP